MTLLHVLILDADGNTLADVDAGSTVDAMAYFLLASPHIAARHEPHEVRAINEHGDTLAAQVKSSWPSPHTEHPTADYVAEARSPISIEGVHPLLWQYIARVKDDAYNRQTIGGRP